MSRGFVTLLEDVRACTLCSDHLPLGARPVLQVDPSARILVAGQAPGSKVHASGVPFDDASGERLRAWMGIDRDCFYDPAKLAILPMGFCYPGRSSSGDLPPRIECAEAWREKILGHLVDIRLTLLIGQYAHKWHLGAPQSNLTETVRAWLSSKGPVIPLPHPSPRNNIWLKRNPWFSADLLPEFSQAVQRALR